MATLVLEAVASTVAQTAVSGLASVVGHAFSGSSDAAPIITTIAANPETRYGPRLTTISGVTSMEGAPIPRLYGRARIGGQMIWASRFIEQTNYAYSATAAQTNSGSSGGKSSSRPAPSTAAKTTVEITYSYFANFAIGLCEGPIAFVRRVWADGQELDLTTVTMRVHCGDEAQAADPLLVAIEKEGSVPAYRGLAYVVFERLPLAQFGDRVPQFTFEVVRPVAGIGDLIHGVDLIPGATEFGYSPSLRMTYPGPGVSVPENRNQTWAATDWIASIDALQALCPNLKSVALVVAWFGDDLRCGMCTIAPRVELRGKMGWPEISAPDWSVAGLDRASARLVTSVEGVAAAGGTPSDDCVIAAIQDLRSRGLSVVFYPFVMMDISGDNALANPWAPNAYQPAYPWRGRITCHPAPGCADSVDGTQAAGDQTAQFFGSDYPSAGEWSYRRFILHYAWICGLAGGVDAFLVGSELAALTRARSASGVYPAVLALRKLADDMKASLGAATKISYAADWTEYGAHVLGEGREVRFPLDSLWASASIDFIGLDAYWPLTDWRAGACRDADESGSIYDLAFLNRRFAAGEAYDWFYASPSDRERQIRTPITDGAYGKPWIYRQKDLVNWWSNPHFERVDGAELPQPTAWGPRSKPIWLMETGCPAIDKGTNAPNVFPDEKSSEGGKPYFSSGFRDDLIQARFIEAVASRFDPNHPLFDAAANPISPLYGGRMIEPTRIHYWAWDARPFPAFPMLSGHWADAANWGKGHWLNGRLEGAPLDRLLKAMIGDGDPNLLARCAAQAQGFVDGYLIDRTMSLRAAIEQLVPLFGFDAIFSSGRLAFRDRGRPPEITLTQEDFVPWKDGTQIRVIRGQESELPREIALTFCDADNDYASATVLSRRLDAGSLRRAETSSALVTRRGQAQAQADILLEDLWVARQTVEFQIKPTRLEAEVGDIVSLANDGAQTDAQSYLITRIVDGQTRQIYARAIEKSVFESRADDFGPISKAGPTFPGPADVAILDLAYARTAEAVTQYIAATAHPWTGPLTILRKTSDAFQLVGQVLAPATMGWTLTDFKPGPIWRFDRKNELIVKLQSGTLASVSTTLALQGASAMAIQGADGAWEIFSFVNAELIAANIYRLSRFIRGLGGEDLLADRVVSAGARVVMMNEALCPVASGPVSIGRAQILKIGPSKYDPAHPAYRELTCVAGAKAYRPYAPVRLKARAAPSGIELSFIRRTRLDGDGFDISEVPLSEEAENYEIVIHLPGGGTRTILSPTQSATYAAADIARDFATPPQALDVSLYQLNAVAGRGFERRALASIF